MPSSPTLQRETTHRLYAEHFPWLQEWIRCRLQCTDTAADLAQDTFVRLLRKPAVPGLRQPRAYLVTIARGIIANHWRRRDIEAAYREALAARPEPLAVSPEEEAEILETLVEVDAMLARLPHRVRSAFLLARLDGLTYQQIGQRLGVSERMVKKYMARAMYECLALAA